MEVREFQKKLSRISEIGKEKKDQLDAKTVREFFRDAGLDQAQLLKVVQYLRAQGIMVISDEGEESEDGTDHAEKLVLPLSEEEEQYWKEYRESLRDIPVSDKTTEELFEELSGGDPGAQTELVQRYLLTAAELAVEMNCEEISVQDLIQEANVSLMSALAETEPEKKSGSWLKAMIRKGIRDAILEQQQVNYGDDILVQKVQKLGQAIRELNEDEENPHAEKFTAAEISVILDIPLEELKATLRLTGEAEST